MSPIPQDRIVTTNLSRGAFFLCKGCDLDSISFTGNGRNEDIADFKFTGAGILELDKEYRNGTALVNPVQYESAINELRDHLFTAKRKRKQEKINRPKRFSQKGYRNNS